MNYYKFSLLKQLVIISFAHRLAIWLGFSKDSAPLLRMETAGEA